MLHILDPFFASLVLVILFSACPHAPGGKTFYVSGGICGWKDLLVYSCRSPVDLCNRIGRFPPASPSDTNANLYEADVQSNYIYKFTPAGARSTFASGLNNPADIAFDANGDLFETDYSV